MVIFNKESHTYVNPVTNEIYISVSQLLSKYKEPFKKDFLAEKVAKKQKVSKQTILDQWDEANKKACDRGQNIHTILENYIKKGDIDDGDIVKTFIKVFDKNDYIEVKNEHLLYCHDNKVAGTSDCIADVDEMHFDVIDFKTNKKFNFENKYGEYLKPPLNNLQHCQYNDYSLQLSLYGYLYSKLTGKRVRKIEILYYDGISFIKIPVPYLYWEIQVLLKHYGQNLIKQS